ncbi:MAG: hypothetical protein K6T75_11475, partial [Acetobacteraceae bacterium]|nr:hypothetical protein [Acetobacteraceae bacterium]
QIGIEFGLQALNSTITTGVGSTSGMDALGYAADCIRLGRADCILAGGFEEVYCKVFQAYERLGLLAHGDGDVTGPRPFDRRRGGLVLGEAVGVCVLEDLDAATRRGARIYAELVGYGTFTGPVCKALKRGGYRRSLSWAMAQALEDAGLTPAEVDVVAAEGSGTALGDRREAACLHEVLGERAATVPVFSFKGTTGYCLGANGALGAAVAALALHRGTVPPTAGFGEPDPACRLAVVAGRPLQLDAEVALVNATGPLTASSLVLKRWRA